MPSLDNSLTFFSLALILAFTPGPDNIFVLMQSASQGRRAGMFVMFGLCAGLVVHTLAVALGLAALFAASSVAFTLLKFAGAAYLAYLAWKAFGAPTGEISTKTTGQQNMRGMFFRGMIMNLTNPKVVLFFLALLPQFVRADRGKVGLQVCWLGLIFILSTLVAFGAIIFFAAAVSTQLRRSARTQRWLNVIAGVVFLGLALRLALIQR